jgi:sigma-B regulation protein RsbU (phosphoserine phosphatase)
MPRLTLTSEQPPSDFQFDSTIVIGRGGTADFVVPNPSVSRRHAMVTREGDDWFLEDLGSGNGTFLNDRIISQRSTLANRDQIRLGSVVLLFENTLEADTPAPFLTSIRMRDASAAADPDRVLVRVPCVEQASSPHTLVGSARRLRLLENLAKISSMVFDERALLSFVVDELFEMMPQADRAFVMVWDHELNRLVPNVARTRTGVADEIHASKTLLDDVLAKREAVLILDAASDQRYANAQSISVLKIRTAICTPIVFQNQIFGVIQIDSTSGKFPFSRADVVLTVGISAEVGMALAYARVHEELVEQKMMEHDLELARKIQHHFLPAATPDITGYSFGVEYKPALAVGGDLYDFIDLGPGLKAIVVGDVSGKGVSAALYSAKLLTHLRYVAKGLTSPAAILSRVNDVLASDDHEGMFVTATVAVLDDRGGRFTVASAGHPLPFARDGRGEIAALGEADGPAIGMLPGAKFRDHEYELDTGDTVVFYTDGVIEALNTRKEMFGEEGLLVSLKKSNGKPHDAVQRIAKDVYRFAGSAPQSDDVTIVSVGRS